MAVHSVHRVGLILVALLLLTQVTAHLELTPDELVEYYHNLKRDSHALSRCLKSPHMREHNARMLAHRDQTLQGLRKARGIDLHSGLSKPNLEDAEKWITTDHEIEPGQSRDPQELFDFRWNEDPRYNTGCVLTPGSIYGPYWHEGQPQRQDIRAGKLGIYLRLAMQVIDVSTCMPLHGAQVDVWHATSSGNYSPKMDGYLRGWQPTSNQGTVDFDTNFPGHYIDRASHIHVVVRAAHEKRVVSLGQIYFDQNIRDAVEKTVYYKNNDKSLKQNIDDAFIPYDSSDMFDPFVRWSRIGNSLEGLLAWITLGVNTTNYNVQQPPDQKHKVIDWHLA